MNAMRFGMLVLLGTCGAPGAAGFGGTCMGIKQHYNSEGCCGQPSKVMNSAPYACPYNFAKPTCATAEPQSPRDLTDNAPGDKVPKASTLDAAQAGFMPLVNVHFHLGAEHKSAAYSDSTDADAWDASHRRLEEANNFTERRLSAGAVRPGFMCDNSGLSATQLAPYTFQHCKGQTEVGKSYEVHYVHSSAGYSAADISTDPNLDEQDRMMDGLGGAANGKGILNPMVAVQGQVWHIVQGAATNDNMLQGWSVSNHDDAKMYMGSTTGPSHDQQTCSPYAVTWHVDRRCYQVSPQSFDKMCKQMKEQYNLELDLYPHGSRQIVNRDFVVQWQYVENYA